MIILKAVLRLYLIQFFAFGASSLSMYFPGLDLLMAGVYLFILLIEGRLNKKLTNRQKLIISAVWQGPAIFLAIYIFFAWSFWNLNNYAIFILQFWSAPLLSIWSLIHIDGNWGYPVYYYLILLTPVILAIFFWLGANSRRIKNTNPLAASNT